jgi:hypothetical protein
MKPTLRAEKPQQEDWEKECKQEFIETFEYCEKYGLDTKDIISSLGIGVCKQERQRLIDEVGKMVESYFQTKCFSSTNPDTAINLKYVQNTIKIELLNKLKGIK